MAFKPIRTRSLYQEIVEQIRELMAGGELKPGDKLLSERDLAERLQVSRPSVREAIRSLELMGFVEIRRGGGTFVRDTNADEIIRPLAMFLAVERSSLLEMFEVRRVFETATARMAAERASPSELGRLEAALEAMRERFNARDSEKGEEADVEFHYVVAEATHNALLIRLFRTLSAEFSRAVSVARRQLYLDQHNPKKLVAQHRRIYAAIKGRDPESAARAMREHLNYAERELRKRIPARKDREEPRSREKGVERLSRP
jgi:GntR family transcriptional regulator, transcriptional repressor for pyruvate dehydrogenase complex